MAPYISFNARRLLLAGILASPAAMARVSSKSSPALSGAGTGAVRSYITEMHRAAFKENLLRVLRTEIAYEAEIHPASPPPTAFGSFSIEDRHGEQWIRLRRRSLPGEELKVEATMFDGAAPSRKPDAREARLHITVAVEVSRDEDPERALRFECSAWPDALDVEKVFAVGRGPPAPVAAYTGPDFKQLDGELQEAASGFLEARGVDEELAAFLHEYMVNKYKRELLRWLSSVEACVKRK